MEDSHSSPSPPSPSLPFSSPESSLNHLLSAFKSPYSSLLDPARPSSSSSFSSSSLPSSSFPATTDSLSSSPSFSFSSSPSNSNLLNSSPFNFVLPSLPYPPSTSASPPTNSSSYTSSSPFSFSSVPFYSDLLNSTPYSSLFNSALPSSSYSPSLPSSSSSSSMSSSSSSSSSIENLISPSSYPSIGSNISSSSSHLSPADRLSSYMSSTMSPSSVATTSPMDETQWKYDVFVSFRGEDTRNSFASHLFHALGQEGYTCFRDNDKQTRGMVIESKLLDAIRHSMVSLVLFSKNYADSRWCLNELVEILECHKRWKEDGHLVLPIFYDVEPGEVRKQTGKFGEGFERCKKAINWDAVRIDKWKAALVDAGNLSGWHLRNDSNGDEAHFIGNIVCQLTSMKLPAKRRKQHAMTQAATRKVNALKAGYAQIDAIFEAAPQRNTNELLVAIAQRNLAYVQLARRIHDPDFVDKLLSESSDHKN